MATLCLSDNTTQQNGSSDTKETGKIDCGYIDDTNATTNVDGFRVHTDAGGLYISSVVSFDVSSIPSGATVNSADLYAYHVGGAWNGETMNVRRVLQAAVPSEVTWTVYSTGNNWATAGAQSDGTDRVATPVATWAPVFPATSQFHNIADLTSAVQAAVDGTYTLLLLFEGDSAVTDSRNLIFRSDTEADGTRPELVIDYTAASGSVSQRINNGLIR